MNRASPFPTPPGMRLPRFCFEGDMLAPTASGRMIRELLHAARRLEMPLAVNLRHRYGPSIPELSTPFLAQVAERPPSGRMRLSVGPVFSWPPRGERGVYWGIGGFDCVHPLPLELERLKQPQRVWVPTQAHLDAALAAGIPAARLDLMTPSVNRRVFHPDHEAPELLEKARPFRILAVVNPLRRKGIDLILRAYLEEFRPNEPVTLILKLTHLPKLKKSFPYEIADLAKRLGAINNLFPNVQVIAESWTDEQLAGLMANCQALVSANRAYHTGLVVREAMACSLPVIGPALLSRILDFDEECGYPVPSKPVRVPAEYLFSGAPEATVEEIDIPALRARMREVFDHRGVARRKGQAAMARVARCDEWQDLAERLRNAAPLVPIRTIEEPMEAADGRESRSSREDDDSRGARDHRETDRSRERREPRPAMGDRKPREPHERREPRESRQTREPRQTRESRQPRESRESDGSQESRQPHESRKPPESREPRESREPSQARNSRDTRGSRGSSESPKPRDDRKRPESGHPDRTRPAISRKPRAGAGKRGGTS